MSCSFLIESAKRTSGMRGEVQGEEAPLGGDQVEFREQI